MAERDVNEIESLACLKCPNQCDLIIDSALPTLENPAPRRYPLKFEPCPFVELGCNCTGKMPVATVHQHLTEDHVRHMYLIAECLKKANCTQNKLAEFENAKYKSSVEASFSSSFHANAIVAVDGSKGVRPYRFQSDGHLMPRASCGDSDGSCVSSIQQTANFEDITCSGTIIWKLSMQMENDYSGRNFTTGSLPFLFGHKYKKFLHLNLNGDGIGKDIHPSLFLVITKEQDNPKSEVVTGKTVTKAETVTEDELSKPYLSEAFYSLPVQEGVAQIQMNPKCNLEIASLGQGYDHVLAPEPVLATLLEKHCLWIIEVATLMKAAQQGISLRSPPVSHDCAYLSATLNLCDGEKYMILSAIQPTASFFLTNWHSGEGTAAKAQDCASTQKSHVYFSLEQLVDPNYNCNGTIYITVVMI